MTLKVRDKVLMQEMRKGGKLNVQFGARAVYCNSKGRFCLQDQSGAALKKSVNYHRLKLWLKPDGG